VIGNFLGKYGIPCSDRGADGELKLASFYSSWKICSAPGCLDFSHLHALTACFNQAKITAVIGNFFGKYGIPCFDRGADGELKLTSFYSSWKICSAPGCLDFSHLHALTACFLFPPPPDNVAKTCKISYQFCDSRRLN
jgi:hypothetical protein